MSLSIFVPLRQPGPDGIRHETWPAGTEDYRSKLWGNPHLKGELVLLPQIQYDLKVEAADFDQLLAECSAVRAQCAAAISSTARDAASKWWRKNAEDLLRYMDNMEAAVQCARAEGAAYLEVD